MNCVLCKGNLIVSASIEVGEVNHIVDLGNGIIIKDVPANIYDQYGGYYVDIETVIKLEKEQLLIEYNFRYKNKFKIDKSIDKKMII